MALPKSWQTKVGAVALSAALLSGCAMTPEEQAQIESVMTALPTEVEKCTFLGDVTTTSFTLEHARMSLKLQVAQLGGNHLVETSVNAVNSPAFGYGFRGEPYFYGMDTTFYLSGRAYYCPAGTGVKGLVPVKKPVSQLLKDGPLPEHPAPANSLQQDPSLVLEPQASLYLPYRSVDQIIPPRPYQPQHRAATVL